MKLKEGTSADSDWDLLLYKTQNVAEEAAIFAGVTKNLAASVGDDTKNEMQIRRIIEFSFNFTIVDLVQKLFLRSHYRTVVRQSEKGLRASFHALVNLLSLSTVLIIITQSLAFPRSEIARMKTFIPLLKHVLCRMSIKCPWSK